MSSIIGPMTPGSTHVPEDVSEQIENLFIHVEAILTAAGGTWADVIKMNFFVASLDLRAAINSPWVERFPDVGHRPARHSQLTSMAGVGKVQCDVTAYILAG